ncbi:hypothetical protein APF79_02550 [bacterium BRH_c32]|nr:MAG: hypothetical protein APF79_02550 [bacterium BRH_c32]
MNKPILNARKIEYLVYVILWMIVFSVPYFNERTFDHINWGKLISSWTQLIGFFLLFCINVFFLVPRLLLKKKYLNYFIFSAISILLTVAIKLILTTLEPIGAPMLVPPPDGFRVRGPIHSKPPFFMLIFDTLIICVLIIGASTTIGLIVKWLSEEKMRKSIEKEQLKTNLALLKNQVSPHFFMNTLNNIHSLIPIDTDKAQEAIERLSILMRYLLYDSAQNSIELKKEIEFIKSFISLMQLRYSNELEILIELPEHIPDIKIPPMLFISLIENAFKHGVNYPDKSYINLRIEIIENALNCEIKNSKHNTMIKNKEVYSGIGLDNIKKSLQLLYEDNYELIILDKENEFEVNLKVPI